MPEKTCRKVSRVRRIRSDCTSRDERSRSVSIQISTAELVSQTLRCPRALLPAIVGCDLFAARNTVCEPCLPLLACRHLLRPPTTSAAAVCFAKTRPKVIRVWKPSWGESEQSDFGWFSCSLEHEAISFHMWHKSYWGSDQGCNEWSDSHACCTFMPFKHV